MRSIRKIWAMVCVLTLVSGTMCAWAQDDDDLEMKDAVKVSLQALRIAAIRAWSNPDRGKLNVEMEAMADSNYAFMTTTLRVKLYQDYSVNAKPLVEKAFELKLKPTMTLSSMQLSLPKNLNLWTMEMPLRYTIRYEIWGSIRPYNEQLLVHDQDIGWQGEVNAEGLKTIYEDGTYAGYDGELPYYEIDFRTRNIRQNGYLMVRDRKTAADARYARDCARLGMLYEPLFKPYSADGTYDQSLYLRDLSIWVKERACYPSIVHWLLPAMPDSVAELCRKRIAIYDNRPVLMAADVSQLPADEPLPEPSLAAAPLLEDTVTAVAPASILNGAPGIDYLYRVNCGGGEVTDSNGQRWMADTLTTNLVGRTETPIKVDVAGVMHLMPEADQMILQSYRICNTADSMRYHIPADSLQCYCVELYVQEPILGRGGGRVFSVRINNQQTDPMDIRQIAGGRCTAVKLAFPIFTGSRNYLDIRFPKPYAGHAIISAIAVGKVSPK